MRLCVSASICLCVYMSMRLAWVELATFGRCAWSWRFDLERGGGAGAAGVWLELEGLRRPALIR